MYGVGIIAGGRADGGFAAGTGAGGTAGTAGTVRWRAGGSVLVGRRIVRSSVSMRGRTEPRSDSGDGGRSLPRARPRRFMFGAFAGFAMGGVEAAACERGGSMVRMDPAKRVVFSSSSTEFW
jgi:hypothetical protein